VQIAFYGCEAYKPSQMDKGTGCKSRTVPPL